MKPSRHYIMRIPTATGMQLDRDIWDRPMYWSIWLKAMFSGSDEWRLVFLPEESLAGLTMIWDTDELIANSRAYRPENPTWAHVLIWAIESIVYGTSLKFWAWREFHYKQTV